jgi:hypothetical protein
MTPWTGISPYLRPEQHKQNKHKQTTTLRVGFEPVIPAFVWKKIVHASERAATVTGKKAWQQHVVFPSGHPALFQEMLSRLSRDSSGGIARGHKLGGQVLIPCRGNLFLLSTAEDGFWRPKSVCPMSTWVSLPGGKASATWRWPFTSIYCRGVEWWSHTSTPHMSSRNIA